MDKREQAISNLRRWKVDPVSFVREVFRIEPDLWQLDTLNKLGGPTNPRRRGAMKACTGPGKSAVLAWEGWRRLLCYAAPGEHPKGAAISGLGRDNLRDNLWSELSKWQQRSELLKTSFVWTKELIFAKDHPSTWFLSARSYAKDADTESIGVSLSGLHSRFPFVLLDEIGEMPITLGQRAEQIFTGGVEDGLILGAGNPTTTDGLLYEVCSKGDGLWWIITITADPDDPKRTPRVDIEHAREQIKRHGRDNFWVMSTILGLFPPGGLNTLLGYEEVMKAMNLAYREDIFTHSQKRLGVDVARFGDDRTVIFPRQGLAAFAPAEMRNARSNEIAARVMKIKSEWRSEVEMVDGSGGYGSGVVDSLIQAGCSPMEVSFSGKAIDPRYYNKRAEMWFEMAEWIKRGGSLPNIPDLVKELTSVKYGFKQGKFVLEEKDQIKSRLGFSPDYADALALTFAIPEQAAARPWDQLNPKKNYTADYDPFDPNRINNI